MFVHEPFTERLEPIMKCMRVDSRVPPITVELAIDAVELRLVDEKTDNEEPKLDLLLIEHVQ